MAWLLTIWLVGWVLLAWRAIHPYSWEAVWGTLHNVVLSTRNGRQDQGGLDWLQNMARWGQIALYTSTGVLALYAGYAAWVWRKYVHDWLPTVREERLQGGCVLEILIPTGSKADARAAADMFGQLWNLLSDIARLGAIGNSQRRGPVGIGKVEAERLALSFEIWSTPHTDGKVGFYVWCPRVTGSRGCKKHGWGGGPQRTPGRRGAPFNHGALPQMPGPVG